ncbi:alpha/beta fold hydrolase [Nocardia sp. alder85J]|uniref:alpha/beta fold hydrolase n=1 Tax=Nocardia sp. alder85J TaxID=2862949 RepID=UPI001CD2D604|nr:alpha/beta fold hydrolase [Nocardia sp. alder85J]MCX4097253.1 alpha/beta fold hydrolase [Nocardia sp. alder85J]
MRTVRTSMGEVAYEETGDGPPVFLLHANAHDHHDFDAIVPGLAREHRVIAVDWPGHGASAPNPDVTATGLADALAELVAALTPEPAVFIGNSVGGFAAARLAIEDPSRVAGLVLVDTGGFVRRTLFTRAYCRAYAFAARPLSGWLLPRIVRAYTKPRSANDHAVVDRAARFLGTVSGRATYVALWRSFGDPGYDLTGRADRITAPTLVVWGRRDPVAPLFIGRATSRCIPGARLEVLDTGHMPFSSAPDEFLDLVTPFVRSALDRRPRRA